MASALGRKVLGKAASLGTLLGKQKTCQPVTTIQVAYLRATYGEPFGYLEPYPYRDKKLHGLNQMFDSTMSRMNENSKVLLVDGNIAIGKKDFGHRLSKNFDLRFYPPVPDSRVYVHNNNNFDRRELNSILPESCKFYTLDDFYAEKNPHCGRVGKLQMFWFWKKVENYCSACLHLLSSGQGVVVASSAFSEIAHIEALKKLNYITPKFYQWHIQHYKDTICELIPPHMCIYLSAPIEAIRERIKQRNDPREVNSKLLTDEYLQALDESYREFYLQKMKETSEIVEIDWTEVGDDLEIDAITDEIEGIVLENQDTEDEKFREWRFYTEENFKVYRKMYSRELEVRAIYQGYAPVHCPEIVPDDNDVHFYENYYITHPALHANPGEMKNYPDYYLPPLY